MARLIPRSDEDRRAYEWIYNCVPNRYPPLARLALDERRIEDRHLETSESATQASLARGFATEAALLTQPRLDQWMSSRLRLVLTRNQACIFARAAC